MNKNKKIALFIDCENVKSDYIDEIISDLAIYGEVYIRKAYGNWQNPTLKGWNDKLFDFSLEPIHQPPYNSKTNKNGTDIKMTVDIMKILCQNNTIDYVALATSDSDFTPLVTEIKSQGIQVIGFSEVEKENKNRVLRKACSEFIELGHTNIEVSELLENSKLINQIKHSINNTKDDDGWAYVSEFGSFFKNNYSKIAKNYGDFKTWGELLKSLPTVVEIKSVKSMSNGRNNLIVKIMN